MAKTNVTGAKSPKVPDTPAKPSNKATSGINPKAMVSPKMPNSKKGK